MWSAEADTAYRVDPLIWQLEHVQRVAVRRMLDLRRDRPRHAARAAAAEPRRDRDVLLAAGAERDRESLHRRAEPRLPQHFAGLDVEGAEVAIEIADEGDAAARSSAPRSGTARAARGSTPPSSSSRRRRRACRRCRRCRASRRSGGRRAVPPRALRRTRPCAPTISMHDWLSGMISSRGRRVIAHRLPVVAALGARARRHPLARSSARGCRRDRSARRSSDRSSSKTFWKTVSLWPRNLPVLRSSFHRMPALPIVKSDLLGRRRRRARARTPRRDRATRRARAGSATPACRRSASQRDRRRGVERRVERRVAAARRHPRLGLRDAPVGEVEIGIVAAGDPGLAAGAATSGSLPHVSPPGLAGARDVLNFHSCLPVAAS